MHLGDDRLRQGGDGLHHLGAAGEQALKIGPTLVRRGPAGLHFLQVMPRAESFSAAAQDHDLGGSVLCHIRKGTQQRVQHGIGQCVQAAGRVQPQGGHATKGAAQKDRFGHCVSPVSWQV